MKNEKWEIHKFQIKGKIIVPYKLHIFLDLDNFAEIFIHIRAQLAVSAGRNRHTTPNSEILWENCGLFGQHRRSGIRRSRSLKQDFN